MNVLVLNCGSSSAKFAVIDPDTSVGARLGHRPAARLARGLARLEAQRHEDVAADRRRAATTRRCAPSSTLLRELGLADGLLGVGHRVVHGGSKFSGSMAITPEVIAKVEECIPLGPLHNPPNLVGIRIAQELFPGLLQVGVFDTAFHQTMPPVAYTYPVPHEWLETARRPPLRLPRHEPPLRRAAGAAPDGAAGRTTTRIVTAHLGNGCSCAAVRNGKSVDTTMGLTPLEG